MLRRAAHFGMAMVGAVLWLVIVVQVSALVALAVLGHKVWPQADRGNCWTHALPRWWIKGGYLAIAFSPLRIGPIRIPHAVWVPQTFLAGCESTEPLHRQTTAAQAWFGLKTLYFQFYVRHMDRKGRWREKGS